MRAARQSVTVPGMDFGMGFNLPANTVAEIETLLRLAELWEAQQPSMSVREFFKNLAGDEEERQMVNRIKKFERKGWIELPHFPPIPTGWMLPEGEELAQDVRRRRESRRARGDAAQDAVLYWLDETGVPEQHLPGRVELEAMGPYGYFLGVQFTEAEIARAVRDLAEGKYITVKFTSHGSIWPEITRKGRLVVKRNQSVDDDEEGGSGGATHNTTYVRGEGATVMQAGTHSSQFVLQTLTDDHRQQLLNAAEMFSELRPQLGLDVDGAAAAEAAEAEVRRVAGDPAAEPGVGRRAMLKLRDAALLGSAGALGSAIAGSVQHTLTSLGWSG